MAIYKFIQFIITSSENKRQKNKKLSFEDRTLPIKIKNRKNFNKKRDKTSAIKQAKDSLW